jgi:hypothetical protein
MAVIKTVLRFIFAPVIKYYQHRQYKKKVKELQKICIILDRILVLCLPNTKNTLTLIKNYGIIRVRHVR